MWLERESVAAVEREAGLRSVKALATEPSAEVETRLVGAEAQAARAVVRVADESVEAAGRAESVV